MSRWRGGDLVATAAGSVVIAGTLLPWRGSVSVTQLSAAGMELTSLARLAAFGMGVLLLAAGLRRSGWTADLLMGGAGGALVAVLGIAVLLGVEQLAFGPFLVLSGSLLAAAAAMLNCREFETMTQLRVISGDAGPPPKGDRHASPQVRNPRSGAHTSNGRF